MCIQSLARKAFCHQTPEPLKYTSRGNLGATLPPEDMTAHNEHPKRIREDILSPQPRTAKIASRVHQGAILPPELRRTKHSHPKPILGATLLPEPQKLQNEDPKAIWELLCNHNTEQLKMNIQSPSGKPLCHQSPK